MIKLLADGVADSLPEDHPHTSVIYFQRYPFESFLRQGPTTAKCCRRPCPSIHITERLSDPTGVPKLNKSFSNFSITLQIHLLKLNQNSTQYVRHIVNKLQKVSKGAEKFDTNIYNPR